MDNKQHSKVSDSNTISKRSKGVKLGFEYDHVAPSGFGDADQVGIDSYVLFGSNTTYVWTRSPQVIMARFRYDYIAPGGFGDADQVGIDSYVPFGSNTTYVWTGSPQVTTRVV